MIFALASASLLCGIAALVFASPSSAWIPPDKERIAHASVGVGFVLMLIAISLAYIAGLFA